MTKTHYVQSSTTDIYEQRTPHFRAIRRAVFGLLIVLAMFGGIFLPLSHNSAHAATNAAVAYADSYWNCTDPSCSSRVSAGSSQPNFQCAEFVSRALSTEGLIPGLNSNSSQSAFGNYHAGNGRTYDLLWVGWTSAYGYNPDPDVGNVLGLYQYLTQNGIASDIGNNPGSAAPGDAVIYHEGNGHTALMVQAGSNALVDAHNNARYHVGYTEDYSELTILHMVSPGSGNPPPPPPPPPGTSGWPNVSEGATGENVASIQLMLQAHGYSLSIDGDFGPQTFSAVESFQSAHGLGVDGQVGPQTWPALIIQTSEGSSGPAVEALQRQLNANGESVSVDSSFGPLTNQAVRDFQSSRALGVDGQAGPQTWVNLVAHIPPVSNSSWPNVTQGASGENVYSIQLMLQARGYSLGIDGSFGPETAANVQAFQAAHGLGVDGQVGPQTWPALIIQTSEGSSGSAVLALQRQLNAHGQSLSIDGSFGPLTTAAVRSYQSSHNLGVDGIAGPQTWQSLVNSAGSTPPPPPPPPPSGSTLWGFDTTDSVNDSSGKSYLPSVINQRGKPDFIGRYIDALSWSPLGSSEAAYIHNQGIRIMVLDSSVTTNDTTYATGVWMANRVITKAQALGIPKGVAIFSDIEAGSAVDSSFIQGWYDTITASGYRAGYYLNPYTGSSQFSGAFCTAIGNNANIASQSIMWSPQPSIGWTTKANAPGFAPANVYCNGHVAGNMLGWQYSQPGGGFNIDNDEISSSVPLW